MGARASKNGEHNKRLLEEGQRSGTQKKALPDQELVTALMQASFHSYEEGHEKPYVTYMNRPMRDTPLNVEFMTGHAISRSDDAQEAGAEEDVRRDNHPPKGWEVVAFVNDTKTDTQIWLYCREKPRKEIIIAFRGTSVKHGFSKDMWTDLNFKRKMWADLHDEEDEAGEPTAGQDKSKAKGKGKAHIQVHTGFHDAYTESCGDNHLLLKMIDDLIAEKEAAAKGGAGKPAAAVTPIPLTASASDAPAATAAVVAATAVGAADDHVKKNSLHSKGVIGAGWHVLLTGHSLGGALATLAAYELAKEKSRHGCIYDISLYTYGAPRVGNEAFARDFDERVPNAWRMVNPKDVVPRLPPVGWRYCHCGTHCRVTKGRVDVLWGEKTVGWFRRVLRNMGSLSHSLLGSWLVFRITKWHGIYKEHLAEHTQFTLGA